MQQCIDEQKALMRVVLKDARLVMLQREGGSVLARVRREEYRFPQSEDYRYHTHILFTGILLLKSNWSK